MKGAGVQYLIVIEMVVRMEKECKNTNEEENMKKNVKKSNIFYSVHAGYYFYSSYACDGSGDKRGTDRSKERYGQWSLDNSFKSGV